MEEDKVAEAPSTQAVAKTKSRTKLASLSPTIRAPPSKPTQPLFKDDSAANQRAKRRRTRYIRSGNSTTVHMLTITSVRKTTQSLKLLT